MAPKKKGNKKAQDDWEAELGETIAPANEEAPATPENGDAAAEDDAPAAGGLMALLKKNKEKRKKKGLADNDFVQGEDAPDAEPAEEKAAPAEANMDDEFALPEKKGKGGKGKQQAAKSSPAAAAAKDGDDELDASGRVLTKAEKEKLKKEREKQRKKEQVCSALRINDCDHCSLIRKLTTFCPPGRQEEACRPCQTRSLQGC